MEGELFDVQPLDVCDCGCEASCGFECCVRVTRCRLRGVGQCVVSLQEGGVQRCGCEGSRLGDVGGSGGLGRSEG